LNKKLRSGVICYRGVDIGRVLSIPLYQGVLPNLYKAIFHFSSIDHKDINSDICIIYSHSRSGRSDYFQIVNNLADYLDELSPTLVVMRPKVSLLDKLFLIKHVIISFKLLKDLDGGLWYQLYLIILIARVKVTIDDVMLKLSKSNLKLIVTFCDAYDVDNIITQCANNLDKTTVTLQHGQYCLLDSDSPENMALANLSSDYLCAWGKATCVEAAKLKNLKTRAIPLGSLRSNRLKVKEYSVETIEDSKNADVIRVMLNADNNIQANIDMIMEVRKYCQFNGLKYCIQFHPSNKRQHYGNEINNEFFIEYKDVNTPDIAFSVVYTSGVMVELFSGGELFFIFKNAKTPEIFLLDNLTFSDGKELGVVWKALFENKDVSVNDLNKVRNYFIGSSDVRKNYINFFKKALKT